MKHYVDNADVRDYGFQSWFSQRSTQPTILISTHSNGIRRALLGIAVAAAWGWHAPLAAGDFDILQRPLTAATTVAPNLVYIHDDSGSMNWVFMPDDALGIPPDFYNDPYSFENGAWVMRDKGGYSVPGGVSLAGGTFAHPSGKNPLLSATWNGLAYNPEVTYPPPYKWENGKLVRMPNSDYKKYPSVQKSGYPNDGNATETLLTGITSVAGTSAAYTTYNYYGYDGGHPASLGYAATPPLSNSGYNMGAAVYWDYVPGYHSMRDNPKYKTTYSDSDRLEDDKFNYEYYAFRTVPDGALFRTDSTGTGEGLLARTAAANRSLVVSRACPTVFPDVMESREYYGEDNPHGQCRVSYRSKGVTETTGVSRGAASFANTSLPNSPNGRPWCVRTNGYNNLRNGTPLVWQPYNTVAANQAATATHPHLSCYAGRHVIGDSTGKGYYDKSVDLPDNYVSYFEYSGNITGTTKTSGNATEVAEANCMPKKGQPGVCTNLWGPEQSRLHLVTSTVRDDGEVEYHEPRRRKVKEEITNFMNWYTYYRSRIMTAKAATSISFAQLVDRNDTSKPSAMMNNQAVRLGYDTLNSGGLVKNSYDYKTSSPGPGPGQATPSRGGIGVVPFLDFPAGTTLPDGTPNKYPNQKFVQRFYNWLLGAPTTGANDLTSALRAVGTYYQSQAPWMDYPPASGVAASGVMSSCRRSIAVLMTDGYNSKTPASGCGTSCYDNTPGANIVWPDGVTRPTYTPQAPFANVLQQNTLADWAMYYWRTDLRADIANQIVANPKKPEDIGPTKRNPAFWQHMQTFTVVLGAQGSISERELKAYLNKPGNWNKPADWSDRVNWGTMSTSRAEDPLSADDLFHAGVNGRGNFYNARNVSEFADGLREILTSMAGDPTSQVSYAGAGGRGAEADDLSYLAEYSPADWSGNVAVYRLCSEDTIGEELRIAPDEIPVQCSKKLIGAPLAAVEYTFAEKLKEQLETANEVAKRNVITWNGKSGIEFKGEITGVGNKLLVDYLRGDKTLEAAYGGTFRSRSGQYLGDIVNSTPYLLGNYGHNDYGYGGYKCDVSGSLVQQQGGGSGQDACTPAETSFLNAGEIKAYQKRIEGFRELGRRDTVFVAANDGMLHAFRGGRLKGHPDAGTEIFAYVPGAIHAELAQLAKPGYQHQYFVDGTPWVGDIILDGKWKSVLVGSTGRAKTGEKHATGAFFALDVEDPAFFSKEKVLWELTDDDLGAPVDIDPVINAVAGGAGYRWAAVFGNGYNSKNGRAGLFIVPMEKDGHLKAEFIPVPAFGGNGLGSPYLLDLTGNGVMDLAYAGDAQGNLWKFDLASRTAEKILEARDKQGFEQPISAPPAVVCVDPKNDCASGYQLIVGTGKFFEASDIGSREVQSIYGVRLDQSGKANNGNIAKRSNMQVRVYDGKHPKEDIFYRELSSPDFTTQAWKLDDDKEKNPPVDYPAQSGYVIDLNQSGMGGSLLRVQGTLVVPAKKDFLMPISLPSADACSGALAGGYAEFNFEHGTWIKSSLFKKIEHKSNIWRHPGATGAEVNRDGKFVKSNIKGMYAFNMVGSPRAGSGRDLASMKTGNFGGGGAYEILDSVRGRAGRQSWRQLR